MRVQYDYKLMQVDLKRQEILERKKSNPRCDTSLDEAMIDKSAQYLQCNTVNPCYLDRRVTYPLRRSINSIYISPTVNRARKALQEHAIERQLEKVHDDRKSVASRKSLQSRRSVHFKMDTPVVVPPTPMDTDTDSEDKSGGKSMKSSSSESKSSSSESKSSSSGSKSSSSAGSRAPVVKRPRATFSPKATVVTAPGSVNARRWSPAGTTDVATARAAIRVTKTSTAWSASSAIPAPASASPSSR